MNKDFEMAKYFATIAGFMLIASSLFFQQSAHFESEVLDSLMTNNLSKQNIQVLNISMKWTLNALLSFSLWAIILLVSIFFAVKGYLQEAKYNGKSDEELI